MWINIGSLSFKYKLNFGGKQLFAKNNSKYL